MKSNNSPNLSSGEPCSHCVSLDEDILYWKLNSWYRMQTTCICLHVCGASGIRALRVKNKFKGRSINLFFYEYNGTIHAFSIESFCENERKLWICPFCLILVCEPWWKGFRKDVRRVVLHVEYHLKQCKGGPHGGSYCMSSLVYGTMWWPCLAGSKEQGHILKERPLTSHAVQKAVGAVSKVDPVIPNHWHSHSL